MRFCGEMQNCVRLPIFEYFGQDVGMLYVGLYKAVARGFVAFLNRIEETPNNSLRPDR